MEQMIPLKVSGERNTILSLSRYNIKLMYRDHSAEVSEWRERREREVREREREERESLLHFNILLSLLMFFFY